MAVCPKCVGYNLRPTLLTEGLSAKGCAACSGVLVDLLSYRAWADQKGIDSVGEVVSATQQVKDTEGAIACPNCSSVMNKYRLAQSTENRLDYCARCDVTWLDNGEWEQLSDVGLQNSLGTVFTEPWQRKIKAEKAQRLRDDLLRTRFGDDYGKIKDFRDWLGEHPQSEEILAWMNDRSDSN